MAQKPVRTLQLNPVQAERLMADIECYDMEAVAQLLSATLARLRLRRTKAWEEIARLVDLDDATENCRIVGFGKIVVFRRDPVEELTDGDDGTTEE